MAREQFISSIRKKRSVSNMLPKPKKGGSLGKRGQVYQNNLLDTDYTASRPSSRKLRGKE